MYFLHYLIRSLSKYLTLKIVATMLKDNQKRFRRISVAQYEDEERKGIVREQLEKNLLEVEAEEKRRKLEAKALMHKMLRALKEKRDELREQPRNGDLPQIDEDQWEIDSLELASI